MAPKLHDMERKIKSPKLNMLLASFAKKVVPKFMQSKDLSCKQIGL